MSLFEDLIDELKDENLLEETVIEIASEDVILTKPDQDVQENEKTDAESDSDATSADHDEHAKTPNLNGHQSQEDHLEKVELEPAASGDEDLKGEGSSDAPEEITELNRDAADADEDLTGSVSDESATVEIGESDLGEPVVSSDFEAEIEQVDESHDTEGAESDEVESEPADTENDTTLGGLGGSSDAEKEKKKYAERVVETVKSLQHVDHIICGVQREQMREKPEPYDSVSVKQALHKFFDEFAKLDVPETTPAETKVLKEIEKWHSALLERDQEISPAHLRRYCETAKPPISSVALVSMARFYRNSPFNEDIRSKFDLIVTRMFSKELGNDKREVVFERDELINHVKELYADWSSVPLYEEYEENSDIVLAAFKFEDYVAEAKKVKSFDELIKKGFFKRIKSFKEKTHENFFAPLLVAAAVESNVAIGNRYIDLITAERKNVGARGLNEKYGVLHDKSVSEATSKSLQISGLLKKQKEPKPKKTESEKVEVAESDGSGAGKWIMGLIGIVIVAAIALYMFGFFGSNSESTEDPVSTGEKQVNLEKTQFREYIHSAKIKEGKLHANVTASWVRLTYKEKQEMIKKIQSAISKRGFKKVQLLNPDGTLAASANENEINVVE